MHRVRSGLLAARLTVLLLGLLALGRLVAQAGPPSAPATQGAQSMLENIHETLEELGRAVGGLSPEQQAKLDALEKALAEKVKADAEELNRLRSPSHELLGQFRAILTPEQQTKLDARLQAARQRAMAMHSAARLRQIGMAAIMHAMDRRGELPADLGSLSQVAEAQTFFAGNSPTTVPADMPKRDAKEQAAWVNQNTDFVWLGAGKTLAKQPATFVLAYIKPERATFGNSFLLADGSVHTLSVEVSAKVVADLVAGKNPPPALDQSPKPMEK
jgi:hypothetical protein